MAAATAGAGLEMASTAATASVLILACNMWHDLLLFVLLFSLGTAGPSDLWPFISRGVSGIRSRLQHQVLVAGRFWQGVQEKEMLPSTKWDTFRGASGCCCVGHGASKDFLFPTLSLVVVTPLYVSHSFSSLVADRLTKD